MRYILVIPPSVRPNHCCGSWNKFLLLRPKNNLFNCDREYWKSWFSMILLKKVLKKYQTKYLSRQEWKVALVLEFFIQAFNKKLPTGKERSITVMTEKYFIYHCRYPQLTPRSRALNTQAIQYRNKILFIQGNLPFLIVNGHAVSLKLRQNLEYLRSLNTNLPIIVFTSGQILQWSLLL